MNIYKYIIFPLLLVLACCFFNGSALAARVTAEAVIQDGPLYVGAPFTFQITVSGTDHPEPPDLSGIKNFTAKYQGGSQNNSSSITIINGKMTKNVSKGYVFSYQLTPEQSGGMTIPAIFIQADNRTVRTRPITVNILKPETSQNSKLRLSLSKNHCYVGEPVVLTVTWYLQQDVRSVNFMIPLLEKKDWFYFIDPEIDQKSSKKYYQISLATGKVIAEQGQASLNGTVYSTIHFSKVLIPRKSGELSIEPATVACEILTGYRRSQRRNPFGDDFFSGVFNNDFFGGRQGIYKKVVAPSNPLRLIIDDVPLQGKPANFAGHIGKYTISATASPTDVNVGDPITLTVTLSGPDYLEHVSLPPLKKQANLARYFKIPEERATGETQGKTRVFTQTLRALRSTVKQIPPIELPYFDTSTGEYKIARTKPIPISVKKTRVVTALDAEGRALPVVNSSEVETWTKGIAYNYEDLSALRNQPTGFTLVRSPVWLSVTGVPPLLYLLVLVATAIIRKKNANPQAALSKKAFAGLNAALKKSSRLNSNPIKSDHILEALRQYLGAKLRISSQAIVYGDVYPLLAKKMIPQELLDELKLIFDACEAGCYAGTTGDMDSQILSKKTIDIAKKLEKFLK